jgi:AcrR family transcriptional regulator
VGPLLETDEPLTYSGLSLRSGVPERTLYRHFPNRTALMSALFDWTNRKIGFGGKLPTTASELLELLRRVFPGFDALAPVVHELLVAPEGKAARLARKADRQRASLQLARAVAPTLERSALRRLAAILQLLSSASTWQALRDYWDMDGAEAAEAAALAVELLTLGAREKAKRARRRG